MKTTSTIKIKYPGHTTQKTAFPLCALPSDAPNREGAILRKTDIATIQVDVYVGNLKGQSRGAARTWGLRMRELKRELVDELNSIAIQYGYGYIKRLMNQTDM